MNRQNLNEIIALGAERAKLLPKEGIRVRVTKDDGSILETVTRTIPWQLGHGAWVIKVEGIVGGFDILRVEPIKDSKLVVGWISVETCMPDADLTVMIFAPVEVDDVWMGFWDGEYWRAVDGSMVMGITHWMNLPLPPI